MKVNGKPFNPSHAFLRPAEVADHLGISVHRVTQYMRDALLPGLYVDGYLVTPAPALAAFAISLCTHAYPSLPAAMARCGLVAYPCPEIPARDLSPALLTALDLETLTGLPLNSVQRLLETGLIPSHFDAGQRLTYLRDYRYWLLDLTRACLHNTVVEAPNTLRITVTLQTSDSDTREATYHAESLLPDEKEAA